jgi:hypothetical protein
MKALALAALIAIAALGAAAHAEEAAAVQPDFSAIESLAAAQDLAGQGKLVPVLLFPAELGGADIPLNKVYVTPEAAAARERAVATVITMLEEGKVNQMDVKPAYKGRSFVPSSIVMQAWHTGKGGRFEVTIPVW